MAKFLFPAAALVAASAFADYHENTLAFYPFNEGASGETAVGVAIKNAVDESSFAADAKAVGTSGVVQFDDDVPGKYVFEDVSVDFPTAVCENPQSIRITSTTATHGGTVKFDELLGEMVKNGAGTLEFFWRVPEGETRAWCQCMVLPGTYTYSSAEYKKLILCVPLAASGTYANLRLCYNSNWQGVSVGLGEDAGDAAWHHFALTYANGKFRIHHDYETSSPDLACAFGDVDEARPFIVGGDEKRTVGSNIGWRGKIACVRLSKVALGKDKFLRASDHSGYTFDYPTEDKRVVMDADTVAFYPFNEEPAGTSVAVGGRVFNAIDFSKNYGKVASISGGQLLYDDDVPGKYVFTSAAYGAVACATNPQSLYFAKDSASSANVRFSELINAFVQNGEGTLEFFWKMKSEDTHEASWSATAYLGSPLVDADGAPHTFRLYVPLANRTDNTYKKSIRLGVDNGVADALNYSYPNEIEDDLWHHLAVVHDANGVRLYCDYKPASENGKFVASAYHAATLTDSTPFDLGSGNYGGKVSCLRVSKRALPVGEMLHASSRPDYASPDVFVWRFDDKADGEPFASLVNSARTQAALNPGIYDNSGALTAAGYVSSLNGVNPTAALRKKAIVDGDGLPSVTNGCSLHMVSAPVDPSTYDKGTFANGMRLYASAEQSVTNSFTMEAFFRFDKKTWMQNISPYYSRDRISVFGQATGGKAIYSWNLIMTVASTDTPNLALWVYYADGTTGTFSGTRLAKLANNAWHHVALTYDESANTMTVYLDYESYLTCAFAKPLYCFDGTGDLRQINVGSGGALNNQPFEGWFDDVRLRRGVHPVSSFFRAESSGRGLVVILQ